MWCRCYFSKLGTEMKGYESNIQTLELKGTATLKRWALFALHLALIRETLILVRLNVRTRVIRIKCLNEISDKHMLFMLALTITWLAHHTQIRLFRQGKMTSGRLIVWTDYTLRYLLVDANIIYLYLSCLHTTLPVLYYIPYPKAIYEAKGMRVSLNSFSIPSTRVNHL